jgi:23S rRNA (adenine1618-N6)-methyltransferase
MSSTQSAPKQFRLHPRNRNRDPYDLKALTEALPELKNFIALNKYGTESVDFANPAAVKALNTALLAYYYGIKNWDFPAKNLCPPVPGRADYIHHMADLLGASNAGKTPKGNHLTCYDIGVGASCIYPIVGVVEYNWRFVASDIDLNSLEAARQIIKANASLTNKVECREQPNKQNLFFGVIGRDEKIDISICNPPYHGSREEAQKGTRRKNYNLRGKKEQNPTQNFAGIAHELVYEGGEYHFIRNMIRESQKFEKNFFWFTTLVSKQSNLKGIYKALSKIDAVEVRTIALNTGNKSSRVVAWTLLSQKEQENWRRARWSKGGGETEK